MTNTVKTKPAKWINHGDVNPRAYGAVFLKDLGDSFEIVQVSNIIEDAGKKTADELGGVYQFKSANVDKADIMKDKGLRDYADANRHDDATNLIWAATAYLGYHGGDDVVYTNNFHMGMRSMGIYRYE